MGKVLNISTIVHWPIYQLTLVKHGYSSPILYPSTGTKAGQSSQEGIIPNCISWQNVLREHLSATGSWLTLWLQLQHIPPNLKYLPHPLPCGELKEVLILFIIAKKKLNICWPRYFIKFNNSHKKTQNYTHNQFILTVFHICTVFQWQSVTYRELTYRTKSVAVKAVPMVIPFHPNMTVWNFHILLFVSNGSKQKWKKWWV